MNILKREEEKYDFIREMKEDYGHGRMQANSLQSNNNPFGKEFSTLLMNAKPHLMSAVAAVRLWTL